jgi:hypothetical protein
MVTKKKDKAAGITRKRPARVTGSGFNERKKKPAVHGKNVKSQLVRIDSRYAALLRATAKQQGISVTEVTRQLYVQDASGLLVRLISGSDS